MKTSEIRELSIADLKDRIEAEKAAQVRTRLNHATSPVENTSTIKKARRDVARMKTVLAQKQTVK